MLLGLGELERTLGRNDQARDAYAKARTLFKQVQDLQGEATVLLGLADLELGLKNHGKARGLYIEARTLFKQVEDRLGIANTLRGQGQTAWAKGLHSKATNMLHKAAHIYGVIGQDQMKQKALDLAEQVQRDARRTNK